MVRLYLIDGTALAYRSHFAFAGSPRGGLTTRTGRPTGAVFGFIQTLRVLLEREKPDLVAVSFDGDRAELTRKKVYPDYKSTRQKMPDELVPQLPLIERAVEAYGIPMLRSPGHEADDVIGTLAVRGAEAGMDVFIVTSDKDFGQIVGPQIRLWNLRSSSTAPEILGVAEIEAKFGVRTDQMIDLLAMMGDSSDNIPGIPKVGAKTAAELLQQFGSMEQVLAHAAEIRKPSIRTAVQEHGQGARLSRDLVTLQTDVPLPFDVTHLQPPRPDRAKLEALFRELEFESLLRTLPLEGVPAEAIPVDYAVVRTDEELRPLLAELQRGGGFAFSVATGGRDPRRAEIAGISVAMAPGKAAYVPCSPQPPLFPGGRAAVVEAFRPLLEDPSLPKFSRDAKHDLGVLRRAGIALRGIAGDTMLASYCTDPGAAPHDLDTLALRHFSHKKITAKEMVGTGKRQKTLDEVDVAVLGRHGAEDADFTWRLTELLHRQVEAHGVERVYRDIELPLVPVLLDMEWAGITVDVEHLRRLGQDMERRLQRLEARIHERAGEAFNLNAAQQIGRILFEKLEVHRAAGMTRPRRTRTGQWKTDADVLEALAPHHEVPELLIQFRMLSKLKGTYVDSLPEMIDPETGRIHTRFNQAVAATGRLSSDDPNLQNIPIRTEDGRAVRQAFVSRGPGWVLLSADYSQIELRILAHMANEQALVQSFSRGEDIHQRTAALVHGLLPNMVTPELRTQAKVINYGLMYGMGASRLARETGLTPPEAKRFIDAYFRALPRVKAYLDDTLARARTEREVRTLFGRRRSLPDIHSTNASQRIAAENMAVNTPIQGTAADIIKRAMIALHRDLTARGLQAKLLLQVHDELVLDVPEAELDEVKGLVRRAMAGAAELAVPLDVSLGTGRTWLEAH
jgi:DNA polymerase-1